MEFNLNVDAHLLDYLDPTKDDVIPAGQTITTSIWQLNNLNDYLQVNGMNSNYIDLEVKVMIPEDYDRNSLNRINSFRKSQKTSVEKVRTKTDMPYFYEVYEALKKVTENDEKKLSPQEIS